MNRRQIKKRIVELLLDSDLTRIKKKLETFPETSGASEFSVINALFSCLCHPVEAVRWHAVSGFGFVVSGIAQTNLEDARTIMRRFLWMLNDESGGIGWGVPEAMGEVMFHNRLLADEYLHMLVSYTMDDGPEMFQDGNFLELDLLQEGVLWGLCRVAPNCSGELAGLHLADNLDVYFRSANANVRGLVCLLVGILKWTSFRNRLEELRSDESAVRYYEDGTFNDVSVADLAKSALA